MSEFRIKVDQFVFLGFEFSETTRFVFLLMSLPRAKFVKQTRIVFSCLMSLPGAFFVKNHVFVILKSFAGVKTDLICVVLSLRSMLESLV